MPAENELKYVMSFDLKAKFLKKAGWKKVPIKQAYLPDGPRVRDYGGKYVFTYKLWVAEKNRDTETEVIIPQEDFEDYWAACDKFIVKNRYLPPKDEKGHHWSVDFIKDDKGKTRFIMAEVEMPEGQEKPKSIPDVLKDFIAYAVPKGNKRFSNKSLSDQDHARKMLKEIGLTLP